MKGLHKYRPAFSKSHLGFNGKVGAFTHDEESVAVNEVPAQMQVRLFNILSDSAAS